jgi:hypothetical protein
MHDITEILLKLALNTGHNPDPVKYAENCQFHSNYDLILLSESEKGLQSCLDSLSSYCNRWKLKINVTKTKVMVFSKGKRKLSQFNFTIDNQHIEAVEKYKYLGVILSYNGNLKHAAEHMLNKGLKAVLSLKSKILDFEFSSIKLKLKLFHTLIRPITTYGSEIWISDFSQKDLKRDNLPFEKIHNRFCKLKWRNDSLCENRAVFRV